MNSLFFLFLFRFGFAQISYSQIPACSTVEGPQGEFLWQLLYYSACFIKPY